MLSLCRHSYVCNVWADSDNVILERTVRVMLGLTGLLLIRESGGIKLEYEFGMASSFCLYIFVAAADLLKTTFALVAVRCVI